MRSVFNIILFLGLIHVVYGQRLNDIIYDTVIIPQFHDLKSDPVKANYTIIPSKIISKTFPKENEAELTLKKIKAPLNIKYLDKVHGLFSNTVNSIQQDEEGFVLNQYGDFFHKAIYCIVEKQEGLWFANYGKGLIRFSKGKASLFNEKAGISSRSVDTSIFNRNLNILVDDILGGISHFDGNIQIDRMEDNGVGIKEEKTIETSSLGLRLVDVFSRQLNAKLNIESDKGVVVKLEIPRQQNLH